MSERTRDRLREITVMRHREICEDEGRSPVLTDPAKAAQIAAIMRAASGRRD